LTVLVNQRDTPTRCRSGYLSWCDQKPRFRGLPREILETRPERPHEMRRRYLGIAVAGSERSGCVSCVRRLGAARLAR
jgi:hypothetical protein